LGSFHPNDEDPQLCEPLYELEIALHDALDFFIGGERAMDAGDAPHTVTGSR